jgi:hypothetical protein
MKRPQRTIDQVAFSSLFLTQELTFFGVSSEAGSQPNIGSPWATRPLICINAACHSPTIV